MQKEKLAKNILYKLHLAEEAEVEKNLELQEKAYPEYTKRYYFFNTMKNKDGTRGIDFNRLKEILEEADPEGKKSLINKLQSGLVAQKGDNFKWDAIAIKTNKYNGDTHKEYVVYYGKLTPAGRRTNNEEIIPEDIGNNINMEQFVKDHNIYVNKSGVTDAVYLAPDQGAFLEKNPTDQDMNFILRSRGTYKGEMPWEEFRSEYMSNYRVWFEEKNELRKPDLSIPVEDDFLQEGQPYRGTPRDLEKLIKAAGVDLSGLQEKIQEEKELPSDSLGEKMEEQKGGKEELEFTPVDEQRPTSKQRVENKYIEASEKVSKIREIKKDDPGANYYVGDFSILQDLVRRQHKKMKLRKAAITTTQVSPITTNRSNTGDSAKSLKEKGKTYKEVGEKLQEIGEQKEKMEDTLNKLDVRSASVKRVVSLFFN